MKVYVELVEGLEEHELIIRCSKVDEAVMAVQQYATGQLQGKTQIVFYKDNEEYYFSLQTILFFETSGDNVFAHTTREMYQIRYRLYELEELLPKNFVRAAKSCILNVNHVYSISRNITSASRVEFANSHKQVYVSRHYYQSVRQCMKERKHHEE